jgi:hypothetical protein
MIDATIVSHAFLIYRVCKRMQLADSNEVIFPESITSKCNNYEVNIVCVHAGSRFTIYADFT